MTHRETAMAEPTARKFTMADLMILVAGAAVGIAWTKLLHEEMAAMWRGIRLSRVLELGNLIWLSLPALASIGVARSPAGSGRPGAAPTPGHPPARHGGIGLLDADPGSGNRHNARGMIQTPPRLGLGSSPQRPVGCSNRWCVSPINAMRSGPASPPAGFGSAFSADGGQLSWIDRRDERSSLLITLHVITGSSTIASSELSRVGQGWPCRDRARGRASPALPESIPSVDASGNTWRSPEARHIGNSHRHNAR